MGWVNSYVIKDPKRNLIIDTGLNRKECLEPLLAGLAEAGVELKNTDFFITHLHADHFALARVLCNGTAKVYMNKADKEYIENWQGWGPIAGFLALNGFPRDEIDLAISNHPGQKYGSDRMPAMSAVKDGDIIRRGGFNLMAVATPGHTSGHTCLYDAANRLLLSGDHILIDITPNKTVRTGGQSFPLSLEPGQSLRPPGRLRPAGTQANYKGLQRQNRGIAEAPPPKASGSALDPGACIASTKCLRGGVQDDLGYRLRLLGGLPRLTEMVRHRGSDSPFETSGKSGSNYPGRARRLQGLFNPLKMAYKTAK